MKGARKRVYPVHLWFTMERPAWWRRHTVTMHMGERTDVVMRSWSWDRADSFTEMLNATTLKAARVPAEATNVVISPYEPGLHPSCCGDPECSDFEDRMTIEGVPLCELVTVTYETELHRES